MDAPRRIAKARGVIAEPARNASVKPGSLHRAPAERGNARLATLHAVNNAVRLRLTIELVYTDLGKESFRRAFSVSR